MTDNEIASKLNNAYDYLTTRNSSLVKAALPAPAAPATGVFDKSLIIFNALVYGVGFLLIFWAVILVFKNFGLWPFDPLGVIKCDDGLYTVGATAIGVLVLLVIGLTLVQGNIEKGEVRKSITISVMIMFYGLVAIHCHDVLDKNSLTGLVLDKFWAIVVAVTGYYFATRAYEDAKKG